MKILLKRKEIKYPKLINNLVKKIIRNIYIYFIIILIKFININKFNSKIIIINEPA